MGTRQDLEQELTTRLMAANNSSMFTATRITQLIRDAHLWATGLFPFPQLERARKTGTGSTYYYYDYPTDFKTDTITRLYIDGNKYTRVAFQDFLDYKDNSNSAGSPDATRLLFADYGRQFFIWPTSTTNGSGNLIVWGIIQAPDLLLPTSTTIFSLSDDQGNEAIVKKAFSVAMMRVNAGLATKAEQDAVALMQLLWKKITDRQQLDRRLDHPFFNVPDFFQSNGVANIGSFSVTK